MFDMVFCPRWSARFAPAFWDGRTLAGGNIVRELMEVRNGFFDCVEGEDHRNILKWFSGARWAGGGRGRRQRAFGLVPRLIFPKTKRSNVHANVSAFSWVFRAGRSWCYFPCFSPARETGGMAFGVRRARSRKTPRRRHENNKWQFFGNMLRAQPKDAHRSSTIYAAFL